MELSVGKDLFALCGKCDAQWHVIVAMSGGKVTKVQCKQCMGYHRYRVAPGEDNVNKAKATTRKKVETKSSSSGPARARRASPAPRLEAAKVEADLSRPVRGYAMNSTYAPGDRIEHPKFGLGVVEALPEAGKVTVFFPEGRRTLAHAR